MVEIAVVDDKNTTEQSGRCECNDWLAFFRSKSFKVTVFFFILTCYLLWNAFVQSGHWAEHVIFLVMLMVGMVYALAKTHPLLELFTMLVMFGAAYFAARVLKVEALDPFINEICSPKFLSAIVIFYFCLINVASILNKSRYRVVYVYTIVTLGFLDLLRRCLDYNYWPTHYLHSCEWYMISLIWLFSFLLAVWLLHRYFEEENPISASVYVLLYTWMTAACIGRLFYQYSEYNKTEQFNVLWLVALYFIVITVGSSGCGKKVTEKIPKKLTDKRCKTCNKLINGTAHLVSAGELSQKIPPGQTPRKGIAKQVPGASKV